MSSAATSPARPAARAARAVAASDLRGGSAGRCSASPCSSLVADGPARGAAHQPVHRARAAARAARHRDDPARRRCSALRSWRRGGAPRPAGRSSRSSGESARRLALVIGLILVYTRRPARPRPAVLARLGALRHGLDRPAAGAAARRRRTRAWRCATSPSRSRSALALGLVITLRVPGRCSWCGCPELDGADSHVRRPRRLRPRLARLHEPDLARARPRRRAASASSSASCPASRRRWCIALLTTLTIKLPANHAILVLICSYVGALYGGSRTAILLNIPGTAGQRRVVRRRLRAGAAAARPAARSASRPRARSSARCSACSAWRAFTPSLGRGRARRSARSSSSGSRCSA